MRGLDNIRTLARCRIRIVGRTQQFRVVADIGDNLALVPDMVAGRDAIDTRLIEIGANLCGDAETIGGVLTLHDHRIQLVLFA